LVAAGFTRRRDPDVVDTDLLQAWECLEESLPVGAICGNLKI